MSLFNLGKVLKVPGEVAKEAAKAAAQLPVLPLDVADKAREGLEEGIDQVTNPKRKP